MTVRPTPRVALVLLLLINLMNYVDRQILAAVEEPIGREFGVGPEATGKLPLVFLLAYMVFAPLFGVLAGRVSRWAIVGGGVIAWSLASGGSGLVGTFGMLMAMRILIGVGEAAYGPVAPTLISDAYAVADRGRVLAWFYAAIPVGSAIGYVVGGAFSTHWHWAFYVTVPPGLALGFWALCLRDVRAESAVAPTLSDVTTPTPVASDPAPQGPAWEKPDVAPPRSTKADYLALLHNRSYVFVTLGMTAMTFAVGGIGFFMPRWLNDRLHPGALAATLPAALPTTRPAAAASSAAANLGLGVVIVVAGLAATLAGGILGDRLRGRFAGSYFLVSGVGMLVAFPLFLLMLVTPFPACWFVLFAAVFCLFLNTGPSNAIIANVTHPAARATAFAANIFVIHLLGDAVSPLVVGYVAAWRNSLDAGFLVVGGAILLGGIFWIAGTPFLKADTDRAGAG